MLWALVMAGGLGTRLWPLSRRKLPKPFLQLIPGRATLLEETLQRLKPLIPHSRILVIGNEEHLSLLRKFAPKVPRKQIIGEPVSRNTAPTVAFGASFILNRDPNANVLVLPADHWIQDKKKFHKAIREAARLSSRTKAFSIFGIKPTFPSPSYGYLQAGKRLFGSAYALKAFIEKPSPARASRYFKTGRFFWHAGIFLAPAKTIVASIQECVPRMAYPLFKLSVRSGRIRPQKVFRSLPSISIDYAVLEKLKNANLIRGEFDWCDVGTWKSFEGLWPKDELQNSVMGSCVALNSEGNIVYGLRKLICLQGVKDLVVIDTPDALLISRKDSAEEMRKVVVRLSKAKNTLAQYS